MRVWELKSGRRGGGSNWNVIFRFFIFLFLILLCMGIEMETSFEALVMVDPTSKLN